MNNIAFFSNFLLYLSCFIFIPCFCIANAEQGKILSCEVEVAEKQIVEKLVPIGGKGAKKEIREHEQLIDEIDVYTLSSHAKLLLLPHMVSYELNYENNSLVDWEHIILQASLQYGVDKRLLWAVIKVESNFIAHAVSSKGAVGAMQIMPETQKELGLTRPTNAQENVFAGTKYLKQQLDYFDGNMELALAAYNAGAGNVLKYNGIPPFKETQNFVKKVLSFMQDNL